MYCHSKRMFCSVESLTAKRAVNSLADLTIPDFTANYNYGQNNGNPFEPTVSTPWELITSTDYGIFTLNRPAL